jgi:diguanylate cyclase (GGDEF)-like protein
MSMNASGFMPHGMCFQWQPGVLFLHTISDGLIAAAYLTIAGALAYVIMRRHLDVPYVPTITMFAAFIVACGLTHIASIVVIWQPLYWTQGWISAATAVLSVLTAITLVPLLPQLIAARSPKELESLNGRLLADATTDVLTSALNRRGFDAHFAAAVAQARRLAQPISLLMIDVDNFKAFNDTFGHPAGDACLVTTADIIKASCKRPGDVVGRFGGEEFAVIAAATDERGAGHLAERIRSAVAAQNLTQGDGANFPMVTVSIGVCSARDAAELVPAEILARADRALYRAKHSGRNCVATMDQSSVR